MTKITQLAELMGQLEPEEIFEAFRIFAHDDCETIIGLRFLLESAVKNIHQKGGHNGD